MTISTETLMRCDAGETNRGWRVDIVPRAQVTEGYDAELVLYDVIGRDMFFGGISSEQVYASIMGLQAKKLLCRINSVGGAVTEGMAIYNLLQEHPAEVTCRVDGLAGSIASVILMAGSVREIAPNAYVMIHNPYAFVEGEEEQIRAVADLLSKNKQSMYAIYAARTGLSTEEIADMCNKTTYLSAEEAVRMQFCTRMTGSKARMLASFGELKGAPDKLQNLLRAAAKSADDDKEKDKEEEPKSGDDEDFKEKFAKAQEEVKDLKAQLQAAKEGDVERMKEDLKAAKAELEEMRAKAEGGDEDEEEIQANARVATLVMGMVGCKDKRVLEGQLMAFIDRVPSQQNSHEARVKALIAEGKLAPARKEWALKASAANLDAYVAAIGNQPILPVNTEHKPNDEAGKVKAKIDPESITLSKEELEVAKQMGTDTTKLLAQKRATLTGQA